MNNIHEYFNNLCFDKKKLTQVRIEITNRCNAACVFCFRNCDIVKKYNMLPYDKILNILDQLKDIGAYEIIITGGEPLLHKDFLKIVKATRDRGFRVRINTNGTLLNENILKEISDLYIRALSISLHSLDNTVNKKIMRYKYNVDDILKNIKLAIKYNIPVMTSTVVCNYNINTCKNDIEYLRKLNIKLAQSDIASTDVKGIKFNSPYSLSNSEIEYYIDTLEVPNNVNNKFKNKDPHGTCNAGNTQLYIAANGDVYPCSMLNLKYGNIFNNSLFSILDSDMKKLIQSLKWEYTESCNPVACEYFDYCLPCYGINLSETGSIFKKPISLCKKAKITKKIVKKRRNK